MRKAQKLLTAMVSILVIGTGAHAGTIYQNFFDDGAASLNGLTSFGSGSISVSGGQLVIGLTGFANGGVGLNLETSSPGYSSVLRSNPGTVSWALNLANQDGPPNNKFNIVLACNGPDPYGIATVGYALMGGGFVGDRMMLYRFDHGLGGGGRIVIDIPSVMGLGTLPAQGSFRVTYAPASDTWTVFGQIGTSYVDPTLVSTLFGSGTDSTHTGGPLPYFALAGLNGGADYFDNLTIAVVPEPSGLSLAAIGGILLMSLRRRCSRK